MRGAKGWTLAVLLAAGGWTAVAATETISNDPVIATIGGDPVRLDDLMVQFAFVHRAEGDAEAPAAPKGPRVQAILDRLINVRLVVMEAKAIDLGTVPEVREKVETHRTDVLRTLLLEEMEKTIQSGEAEEIDALYRDAVREVETRSVIASDETLAREVSERLRRNEPFEEVAAAALETGKAVTEEQRFLRVRDLRPEVARALLAMEDGAWSEAVRLGPRFAVFQRLGERYPEDGEARAEAGAEALRRKRGRELRAFFKNLIDKHVKIDEEVLESLDLDAKEPGPEALRKDPRVVAIFDDGGTVTVADVVDVAIKSYFHGTNRAAREKRINPRKRDFLEVFLVRRLTIREAERRKLDESERFVGEMRRFEEGLLFSTFVTRVIDPEIKLEKEALEAYYEENREKYKSEGLIAIEALTFTAREEAEDAIGKVRRGADFGWVRSNAVGSIDPPPGSPVEGLSGSLVPRALLAKEVREALEGVVAGDFRSLGEDPGPFYVLHVLKVVPERVQPFDAVAESVGRSYVLAERERLLKDWGEKLRGAYDVELKVSGEDLDRLVVNRLAGGS